MKYPENYQPTFCEKTNTCRFSLGKNGNKNLMIIGFNPSTANKEVSDPTMNSVIKFCEFNGYDGYIMVNAYPFISTNPSEIKFDEKIIPQNLKHIKDKIKELEISDILLAYGDMNMPNFMLKALFEILNIVEDKNIFVIKTLKSGIPAHPLYKKVNKLQKFTDIKGEMDRLKRELSN
ncbi:MULTISPECIES: DUF1643 domain-containing protein [unclassified Campylobacter]|uniref:DUF1643 domain-containing protein n=1 Tax=unclassified Campylobacter TaxID=2593542 RepID=UPI0022E9AF1E|nr:MULTISPECIES: DUF1643 domain-containing protein [unclassified Campylobacter]MDA3056328.1 DUF1643 domain-containing protein [Campylobacter sp. CN_NA1]MDA3065541.1 DUF1643 domain-containing protein [Campylobacter sp. CN_NE4]MDA3068841.1 DUF1643 domain-containing protein [Campylobacter sp. CN_NE3]MDA3082994.1 DUF1643 domain-containing protein [Campylobacter sp. CN_EL2]MDA3084426.1 DUF1643 domain-containing protein [Campylobacter sp. CN_NE1]